MNALEYFETSYRDMAHGNSTYINHCFGVYALLKRMGCDEEVCLAGLYHSVYGTDSFDTDIKLSKSLVINLVGERAENLVSIFCHLRNRTESLLNNVLNLEPEIRNDLLCIELANSQEQLSRIGNHTEIEHACNLINNEIYLFKHYTKKFDTIKINGKKVYVFDDLLTNSDIEWINSFCLSSKYSPEHRSNQLNYELDSRFACDLNDEDLKNAKLFPAIKKIVETTGLKLAIKNAYINHYSFSTSTSKHVDSSEVDEYTIIVFCNKFWESTWGGEIVFYDDYKKTHTMVEFEPARILVFDSRILHKVMPLTLSAKKDRYTIAIKCFIEKEEHNV